MMERIRQCIRSGRPAARAWWLVLALLGMAGGLARAQAPQPPYTAIVGGGGYHTCALEPSGAATCWGDNTYGQADGRPGPYTALSVGGWHNCGLTLAGAAECWGRNDSGQATGRAGPFGPYDLTPPSASPTLNQQPNAQGWNNTPVTVRWNWRDADGSPIGPARCPATSTSSGEGVQTLSASCTNHIGNTGRASVDVKVDTVAPTLAPRVVPDPVRLGAPATVSADAADALSGVASTRCDEPNTTTAGAKQLTCTTVDVAGNSASAGVSYTVEAYRVFFALMAR